MFFNTIEIRGYSMTKFLNTIVSFLCAMVNYPLAKIVTCLIPLCDNKYFCISMSGNSYGDNVKYLSDYIHAHQHNAEIVWTFSANFIKNIECPHIVVKLYSFKYYYHILTAKYIISNARLNQRMLHKRQGQIYLQTCRQTYISSG